MKAGIEEVVLQFKPVTGFLWSFSSRLVAECCLRLHGYVSGADKRLGHRVWVSDGSTCSTPDGLALQQAFG